MYPRTVPILAKQEAKTCYELSSPGRKYLWCYIDKISNPTLFSGKTLYSRVDS